MYTYALYFGANENWDSGTREPLDMMRVSFINIPPAHNLFHTLYLKNVRKDRDFLCNFYIS